MSRALIFSALLFLPAAARPEAGQEGLSLRAEARPAKITVGERVRLDIRLRHPPGYTWEVSTATVLGAFRRVLDDKPGPGGRLTLVTFSTGTVSIPPVEVRVRAPSGETTALATPEIPIEVASLLERHSDRTDIQDLKGPVKFFNPWPWAGGVFAAACAAILLRRILAGRRPRSEIRAGPRVPPEDLARRALQELLEAGWIESGRFKEFYSGLSEIIRRYLEDRFDVPTLDRTTAEILASVSGGRVRGLDTQTLRQILETGDLAKFARFAPEASTARRHLALASLIVERTT